MRIDANDMASEVASDITYPDSDTDVLDEDWSEGQDFEKESRKNKLISRIISLVGKDDGDRSPLNVAVIGGMGVGKSSFINTIAAALSNDRWREYAYTGWHGGDGAQVTVFTNSYQKCCVESKYKDSLLPTMIDIAGFEDEDHEKWVELLRIVFYGRLPEGASLAEAEQYYGRHGMDGLRAKYSRNNEQLKVDRVVFVSSSTSPVPTKLIDCVIKAARPSGGRDSQGKRTIPIFGVMTKDDKVSSGEVTREDFEKRETAFIHALGLGGAKHRYLRCRNYCDDVDKEGKRMETLLPDLDLPVLRFMTQLCDPVIRVINQPESYLNRRPYFDGPAVDGVKAVKPADSTTIRTPPRLRSRRGGLVTTLHDMGLSDNMIIIAIISVEAILIAFVLNLLLRPSVDIGKLRGVCKFMGGHGSLERNGMEAICNSVESGASSVIAMLFALAALIGIRVGVTVGIGKLYNT